MQYITNIIKIMQEYWRVFLIEGVRMTLFMSVITVFFGAILGIFICLARMGKFKPTRYLAEFVVGFIRGTPMLLQMYIAYLVYPKFFGISDLTAILVALAINSACYVSEVFRSGIQAVDKGQTEAARSLGLSQGQTLIHVVLPQAIKNILPALGNEFITITKDTSLGSTFFIGEIMTSYLKVKGITYLSLECLIIVAIIYYILTMILTTILGGFERRLHAND